jgi:hypothetical protein
MSSSGCRRDPLGSGWAGRLAGWLACQGRQATAARCHHPHHHTHRQTHKGPSLVRLPPPPPHTCSAAPGALLRRAVRPRWTRVSSAAAKSSYRSGFTSCCARPTRASRMGRPPAPHSGAAKAHRKRVSVWAVCVWGGVGWGGRLWSHANPSPAGRQAAKRCGLAVGKLRAAAPRSEACRAAATAAAADREGVARRPNPSQAHPRRVLSTPPADPSGAAPGPRRSAGGRPSRRCAPRAPPPPPARRHAARRTWPARGAKRGERAGPGAQPWAWAFGMDMAA